MSRPHRKPTASAKHRRPAASAKHRQPAASAKEVAKIAVTGAGFQGADHAGSGGRCAGARAGYPLSALPVEVQHIVRAGVLALVLGVGAAVANTPAVAFAAPDDTSSSGSSSDSSSTSSSSSESAANASSTDATSSTTSSASAAGSSSGSTSETVQSSVDCPNQFDLLTTSRFDGRPTLWGCAEFGWRAHRLYARRRAATPRNQPASATSTENRSVADRNRTSASRVAVDKPGVVATERARPSVARRGRPRLRPPQSRCYRWLNGRGRHRMRRRVIRRRHRIPRAAP